MKNMTVVDKSYLTAYRNTHSDGEAAAFLNIPISTFHSWRDKNGLPTKGKHGRPVIGRNLVGITMDDELYNKLRDYAYKAQHRSIAGACRDILSKYLLTGVQISAPQVQSRVGVTKKS